MGLRTPGDMILLSKTEAEAEYEGGNGVKGCDLRRKIVPECGRAQIRDGRKVGQVLAFPAIEHAVTIRQNDLQCFEKVCEPENLVFSELCVFCWFPAEGQSMSAVVRGRV